MNIVLVATLIDVTGPPKPGSGRHDGAAPPVLNHDKKCPFLMGNLFFSFRECG